MRRRRRKSPFARIQKKLINDNNITRLRKLGKFLYDMKGKWRYQTKKLGQKEE